MFDIAPLGEALPYITATAGAGIGYVLEKRAVHRVEAEREPISPVYEEATPDIARSRFRKLAAPIMSGLFMFGFVSGIANGALWEQGPANETTDPHVALIVDKGYEAGVSDSYDALTNKVLEQFMNKNSIDTSTVVARQKDTFPVSIQKAIDTQPDGKADQIDNATQTALKNAEVNNNKIVTGGVNNHNSLVVITNNNSIGDVAAVELDAKAAHSPVNIVNVKSHEVSPSRDPAIEQQNINDLKAIAVKTGGYYWDVDSKNISNVYRQTTQDLTPGVTKSGSDTPKQWPLRILALAGTVAGFGIGYRKRSKSALGNEIHASDLMIDEED